MKTRIFFNLFITILIVILAFGIIFVHKQIDQRRKSEKLNLVLISIDTLRADHMGVYGYKKDTTPNIDAWAKNAFVFTNAVTVIPETFPSMISIFTSLNPVKSKLTSNMVGPMKRSTGTLTQILKKNKFVNAAFLNSVALTKELTNLDTNFDTYVDYDVIQDDPNDFDHKENYENFISEGLEWLGKHKKSKFFFWMHLIDPHAPYSPPDDLKCKFNTNFCKTIFTSSSEDLEEKRLSLWRCHSSPLAKKDNELFKTLYDGSVAYTDKLVKRIFTKLESTGLDKKTIVVLLSDHGEGFDHNYYFDHGDNLYDSNNKIALLIKHPFYKEKQKKINQLVQSIDIAPTLLQLLHISDGIPFSDGISFSNIFKSGFITNILFSKKRDFAYSMTRTGGAKSIYDGRYKFISTKKGANCQYNNQERELYDISKDPNELHNIYNQEKKRSLSLQERLNNYFKDDIKPPAGNFDKVDKKILQERLERLKSLGY
ncbi:sulfatase [Candidatus Roizmanbacteria bacterium]|nr:sulfatase [Candidatus Roizmanbacteria bacterium]